MITVQSRAASLPLGTTLDGTAIIAKLQSNAGGMQDEHAPAVKHVRHAHAQAGPRDDATDGGEPVKRRRSRQERKAQLLQASRRAPTVGAHRQLPPSELGSPTASRRHAAPRPLRTALAVESKAVRGGEIRARNRGQRTHTQMQVSRRRNEKKGTAVCGAERAPI